MCDGTTNQIELSRTAIAATAIPVAPAAEQTRIANQLDTLLARVQACNDRFDAIPALLKRFRQTVLDAATFGTLTENWRESNGGDYEWQEVQPLLNIRFIASEHSTGKTYGGRIDSLGLDENHCPVSIGHWGTGNLEVPLTSQADLDAVKPFINAAYKGRS